MTVYKRHVPSKKDKNKKQKQSRPGKQTVRQTSRLNTNTFYCFLITHTIKWLVQVNSVICPITVQEHSALNLNCFDFHLSSFSGVVRAFPIVPVHTFPGVRVFAVKIETIQVGMETSIVPPGSFVTRGTVARPIIVVSIFGGERSTTMIGKWVTSSS